MLKSMIGGTLLGGPLVGLGAGIADMAFGQKQARDQRSWEKRMSATAHQREVADLKAAGLNPMLSAGGSGARWGSVQPAKSNMVGAANSAAALMSSKATAKRATAEAASSAVKAKMDQDTLDYYNKNPRFKRAVQEGKLIQEAGGLPTAGVSSAGQFLRQMKADTGRVIDEFSNMSPGVREIKSKKDLVNQINRRNK